MTGQKNRFKTTEKLWDLDDKQLKTPVHDAMVLWLMDEDNAKQILKPITAWITHNDFVSRPERLDSHSYEIKSEIPLQAQNGFINGYADLEITRRQSIKEKYHECKISENVYNLIKEANTVGDLKDILREKYKISEFTPKLKSKYYGIFIGNEIPSDDSRYRGDFRTRDLELKLLDFVLNFGGYPSSMREDEIEEWISENDYYTYKTNNIKCLIEVKPYIDSFGAVLRQINSYKSFWKPKTYSDELKCICLFTFDNQFDKQFESQGIRVLHPPVSQTEMLDMYGLR